ncbi:MAG: hypothetical protein RQ847_11150 [Wenzhouxiangellaceae bacterium]|nr:hypothetical protein [Wenzhouxiangellaceae bacterium]
MKSSSMMLAAVLSGALAAVSVPVAAGAPGDAPPRDIEQLWEIIQKQQQQLEEQRREIEALKAGQQATRDQVAETRSKAEAVEQSVAQADRKAEAAVTAVENIDSGENWSDRVTIGGYGSVRAEASDLDEQNDTFTFRRFVLTADAQVGNRLQTYMELEFERFAELELEKEISAGADEFEAVQVVEGTSESEIAIEQAWARYRLTDTVNLDIGGLLVPLGRFNLNHDDNQWNLTRRSLVDKGVPVLPASAAWPELGLGISGAIPFNGGRGLIDYRLYVMNGAQLDLELEEEVESEIEDGEIEVKSKLEAEFEPTQGGFGTDLNDNKAIAGRVAIRPSPAHEIGFSGYFGRYTPDFLVDEDVWSLGLDGLHEIGGLEMEYQLIHTDWGNTGKVARSFAATAFGHEGENAEIALGGNSLADSRTGYWIELRYPLWWSALNDTFLARDFEDPSLEPTFRFEQVFYNDQLTSLDFADGAVTSIGRLDDARLNRATLGLAYRPVANWVFSLAGEYTWTDENSLNGLTNFLAAQPNEDDALTISTGVAFGF